MGGSGGSGRYFGRIGPEDLQQKVREAQEGAQSAGYETGVNDLLAQKLAECNDRDSEGFGAILAKVQADLEKEVEGTVGLRFGGSVAKHTYVDGISDVDALVLLDRPDVAGKSPADLRGLFAEIARARFGQGSVTEGKLAVTIRQGEKEVQLLPAVRVGEHFKIANADGTDWATIRPRIFADALTQANARQGGKLVPAIKLAKAIIANLPEQRKLSGYHTESLAMEVFANYDGPKTPKQMVQHFFEKVGQEVRRPIRDMTGQSHHLDAYLGPENSLQRQIVADAFDRISRKLKNADGAKSIERWTELF